MNNILGQNIGFWLEVAQINGFSQVADTPTLKLLSKILQTNIMRDTAKIRLGDILEKNLFGSLHSLQDHSRQDQDHTFSIDHALKS